MSRVEPGGAVAPIVLAYAPRPRARAALRAGIGRRHGRLAIARTPERFSRHLRTALVDVAVVDLGAPGPEPTRVAAQAREFPSIAFIGLSPFRPADAPVIAHCAELEFADVFADSVDDELLRHALVAHGFAARFAAALAEPPDALAFSALIQRRAWQLIVSAAGRLSRTGVLAAALGVTREHLSRSFARGGGPSLKRVVDLVRLLAAAELAKNPGLDLRDVARLLGYASSSHLSSVAQRLVGARAASLSAVRAVDLIARFARR